MFIHNLMQDFIICGFRKVLKKKTFFSFLRQLVSKPNTISKSFFVTHAK